MEIKSVIEINASAEEVWKYVSNSDNAREWSVFFHHITPLPGATDGQVGSTRRCFQLENETGMRWDERVDAIELARFRRMRVLNIHGLKGQELHGQGEFDSYQRYDSLGPNRTELTFAARTVHPRRVSAVFLFVRAGLDIKRTFRQNLENIKEAIEARRQGRDYQRLHHYVAL